ncbi:MAG TPA: response regulator [Candidatus Peribacteraceae bacterium]|nr:response regulator [Candidatus Peribacteraceae bacterium]
MADKKTAKAKGKILIVEDERPLAHALELKMTHEGYETTVASTGEEGLKEASSGKYDLILLDLILPGIDGFAILQALKEKKIKTVVIVLSNLGQDEDRKKAEEFGAKQYLVKSNVPLADIVKVVKAAI